MAAFTIFCVISGRSDADGCNIKQPNFAHNLVFEQRNLPHSHSCLRRRLDRKHPRRNHLRQHAVQLRATNRISASPAIPTATAMTASLPASAGRRRTNRSRYSPARPTTSKWASPTRTSPNEAQPKSALLLHSYNPTPEDETNFTLSGRSDSQRLVEFSNFMRFLTPPAPSTTGIPAAIPRHNPLPQARRSSLDRLRRCATLRRCRPVLRTSRRG